MENKLIENRTKRLQEKNTYECDDLEDWYKAWIWNCLADLREFLSWKILIDREEIEKLIIIVGWQDKNKALDSLNMWLHNLSVT